MRTSMGTPSMLRCQDLSSCLKEARSLLLDGRPPCSARHLITAFTSSTPARSESSLIRMHAA